VKRLLLTLGLLSSCSHRDFQYTPRGDELAGLTTSARAFADDAQHQRLEPIAARLDVEGRKALLVFGASLAYEKRERIKSALDQVNCAVVLAIVFEVLGAWSADQADASVGDAVERASRVIKDQLEKDFGVSGGVVESFTAQLTEKREETAARLVASLAGEELTGCQFTRLLVSYDLRLLRFTSWDHADLSRTFVAWKKRARSVHVAELVCEQKRGLLLLSSDDEHPAPRPVAWRFSSQEEHARIIGRLKTALSR
jgi:hypothetical protein